MKKDPAKILMIIGGIMAGIVVLGFFGIGPALIEAVFTAEGIWHILGIVYIVVGVVGFIIFVIGLFIHISDTPSSGSGSTTASHSNFKSKSTGDSYDKPITPSNFYEYGTMRDEFGNETEVTHNTITDTYTDASNNSYHSDDNGGYIKDDD